MKLFLFVYFILATHFSWSGEFDYKRYNTLINEAELQIVDSSYSTALIYFDSAFAINQKPFARDLFNASIAAIKANRNKAAIRFCWQLAKKGVGKEFFSKYFEYSSLKNDAQWKDMLLTAETSRKQFRESTGQLVATLDRLYTKDQDVHVRSRETGSMTIKEIMNLTDDTLSQALSKLFDRFGFIGEDMLGAPLDENGLLGYRFPYDIIILHNYQSRDGDTLFSPVLRKALQAGLIKPEEFAGIQDGGSNMHRRPYYGTTHFYVQYLCSIYLENYHKENLVSIEENRKAIGLCSTADQLKKTIFNIENPGSTFMINARAAQIMSFGDKQSEQYMLNNSEVVIEKIPNCSL